MTASAGIYELLDSRTLDLLERRRVSGRGRGRGWIVRRALLAADLFGLAAAYAVVEFVFVYLAGDSGAKQLRDTLIYVGTLPAWIVLAKLYGLYDRDEERTDHTTVEDMVDVFHLVTVGAFGLFALTSLTNVANVIPGKLVVYWVLAIALVAMSRMFARSYCRRSIEYLQNTVIVGAGEIGQLVARKILQHHEYGLNLVGFVDECPKERREDLDWLVVLGGLDELPQIVELLDVDRVIFAFSNDSHEALLDNVRSLDNAGVQIDVVPRLFEIVSPTSSMRTIEAIPVMSLPPARPARSSRALKRTLDLVVSGLALVVLAPVFFVVALLIKRDSAGPVFFRQVRVGMSRREFTTLKFRTMRVGTSADAHRAYIERTSAGVVGREASGLFKLDQADAVTRVGAWLRRTSLDELPQLINVFRGDMSLVGPRPCMPYELAYMQPHHLERFSVPAGITGLWQVMARAHASFREALDMDVAYVRGWSLALDLRLLFRTPFQLMRSHGTR